MDILNQPFDGHLGDRLIDILDDDKYSTLNIVVAFAKNSGFLRIKNSLEKFVKRGGVINAYVGVDMGGTSFEALSGLYEVVNKMYVIHAESSQTFHSKIYNFIGENDSLAFVGSNNLTSGGLWTNFESSVCTNAKRSAGGESTLQRSIDQYISNLTQLGKSSLEIDGTEIIDQLLENDYIQREVMERISRREREARDTQKNATRMFGMGSPSQLPRGEHPGTGPLDFVRSAPVTISKKFGSPIFWYATQKLTGGSGNQLDLSKTSLVTKGDPTGTHYATARPNFMKGSVEFFGVDASDEDTEVEVAINYEGSDYNGNMIRMHQGDRSNGTWRLQLQGIDSTGTQINEAFRRRGGAGFLKHKIVTFIQIEPGYYFMSVFPDSELDRFRKASRICGHNGRNRTAKPIGII